MKYNIETEPVLICEDITFYINDIIEVERADETFKGRLIEIDSKHDSTTNNDTIKLDCSKDMMSIFKVVELEKVNKLKKV